MLCSRCWQPACCSSRWSGGHCNACHASRNALGATASSLDLAGGLIPVQNWYAPSLTSPSEASVASWDTQQIVGLLGNGVSSRGAVLGPMSEVVAGSTQHLSEPDCGRWPPT